MLDTRKQRISTATEKIDFLRHGVILRENDEYWVIGSGEDLESEICTFTSEKMNCKSQKPVLSLYGWYPELFLVEEHFCIM